MQPVWPDNKKFAFTIVDDTDMSTAANVKPVYEILLNFGLKITKTVWVYSPRDDFTGGCLSDHDYLTFILWLKNNGFEIAFHGAGSGKFTRQETILALEKFREIVGYYPQIHINHAHNHDGMYWGHKRFSPPLSILYKLFFPRGITYAGDDRRSGYFWGDVCKQHVKYIRNRVFSGINTLRYDPYMPYIDKSKEPYSNFWFSASDGCDVKTFCRLTNRANIDRLSNESGCCIVYTHFGYGFVEENGQVRRQFSKNIAYLAQQNAWFAPAGIILDYLLAQKRPDNYLSTFAAFKMDVRWLAERINRKLLLKI